MSESPIIVPARDHGCFGCGALNQHGLKLRIAADPDTGGVQTTFIPDTRFEGYNGMIHGGIIATVLDEVMAWSLYGLGVWGVTADMRIRFRRPVEVGVAIVARGHIVKNRGRVFDVCGTIVSEATGHVLAESTATFMRASEDQARKWRERYRTDDSEE